MAMVRASMIDWPNEGIHLAISIAALTELQLLSSKINFIKIIQSEP